MFKCFSNYLTINTIPNLISEGDIAWVIDELVSDKDFNKSDTGIKNMNEQKN